MREFTIAMPEVMFGVGTRKNVGKELAKYNCKNVVVMCDPFLNKAGKADELVQIIEAEGIKASVYECYDGEPIASECDKAYEYAKSVNCDGLVGLGGGSTMDSAKMVALLLKNGGKAAEYIGYTNKKKVEIFRPIITMPTTAGTGAEVSQWISCSPDGVSKGATAHEPTFAIVDPEYTLAMPKSVTANTGVDALCHSIESMFNGRYDLMPQWMGDTVSKEAIRHIAAWLKVAYDEPDNLEAREHMSFAALLAGYAIKLRRGNYAHAFGNQISKEYHTPHGISVAVGLRALVRYMALDPQHGNVAKVAEALQIPYPAGKEAEVAQEIVKWVDEMLDYVGMKSMQGYGITKEFIDNAVAATKADSKWAVVPGAPDMDLMEQSIMQLWKEGEA